MAIRFSDAAAALMAGDCGLRRALANAHIVFYTGTQPESSNYAATGQDVIAFANNLGAITQEIRPIALINCAGVTGTETVTSITVDGYPIIGATVTGASSAAGFTAALAAAINKYNGALDINAVYVTGATTLNLIGPKCSGTALNNAAIVLAGTAATLISSGGVAGDANPTTNWAAGNGRFGSGAGGNTAGVLALNCLTFEAPASGSLLTPTEDVWWIGKPTNETWSGQNGFRYGIAGGANALAAISTIVTGTTYTAGWGRIYASGLDLGTSSTSGIDGFIRVDFSVGTGTGVDFTMSPAATFLVNTTTPIVTTLNDFKLKVSKNIA